MSQSSSRGDTADSPDICATTSTSSSSSSSVLPNTDIQTSSASMATPSSLSTANMASEATEKKTMKTSKLGAISELETETKRVSSSTSADTSAAATNTAMTATTIATTPIAAAAAACSSTTSTTALPITTLAESTGTTGTISTFTPLSSASGDIPLALKQPQLTQQQQSVDALQPLQSLQNSRPQSKQLLHNERTSSRSTIDDNHLRLPPNYQSNNTNTVTATANTTESLVALGPYIDAKNTLQSHSILVELQEARQASTLLLSTVPLSHDANKAKKEDGIKANRATTTDSAEEDKTIDGQSNDSRITSSSQGGDEFYKHTMGLGQKDDSNEKSAEPNSKPTTSSLLPPISALTEEPSEIAATNPSISISGQPVVSRHAAAVNNHGNATDSFTTNRTLMVEAQFLYEPDGRRINALPMQAAQGEVTSIVVDGGGTAVAAADNAAASPNDLAGDVEASVAAATDTTATTSKRPPVVKTWWKQRKWRHLVAIVVGLLLVLIGSLISTLCLPYESCRGRRHRSRRHRNDTQSDSSVLANETTIVPPTAVAIDPTALRAALMTEFINNITLSRQRPIVLPELVDDDAIMDNSVDFATEVVALSFLVYQDPLQLPVPNFTDFTSTTPTNTTVVQALELMQRYAILTLTTVPYAPDGSDDDMIGRHVCEWRGIVCNETSVPWRNNPNLVVTFNAVTRIEWTNVIGDGRLLPDLAMLSHSLVHFDLSRTGLSGSIPEELGAWTNLQYFNVAENRLTGSLPLSLYLWTNIEYINVHGNSDERGTSGLTGSLPESLGMSWTNLTYFDIGWNTFVFSDWPDYFARWTRLEYFDMGDNALFGTISAEATQNWTQLQHFNIANNDLVGSLPSSIGVWTALRYFDAKSNDLTGSLPSEIGLWTNLEHFDAPSNSITGNLPSSVGQWTAVKFVNVAANSLTGPLPDGIGNWTHVTTVMLGDNRLSGTIPASIGNWTSFTQLFFDLGLEGTIPPSLCRTDSNRTADYVDIVVDCATVNCSCGPEICVCP